MHHAEQSRLGQGRHGGWAPLRCEPEAASTDEAALSSLDQVIENCPVTGIQVRADDLGVRRVKAVETPHGTIETPCVVNCAGQKILGCKNPFVFGTFAFEPVFSVLCAGAWANKLGKMAGVKVPLVAMHHAYVVTERIEGIQVQTRPVFFRPCVCVYSAAQC